ncbi:MAG: tRNA (N(6)-L-threonylcarbamoyladenosine(37)-C(2))-methylthiotransferase MtaB [Deltaproteobacteria bacterium RBG_13_61_14]|nr:MAG: tRNA (N(6)-L-threonylcarbamoyladenosine(37)-C(2))-methylthiotransferase MtaB [Deltaproteobacteria bacterium RBG_13_61_14]
MAERKLRVAFLTLGCKANHYDSMALMAGLDPLRFEMLESEGAPVEADIYVINTCTVTGKSDFQSRQLVRRARKWNPAAKVLVTGCLAETQPHSLQDLPQDGVIGVHERGRVIEWITGKTRPELLPPEDFFYDPAGGRQRRTRALVKVQDGCDLACAYCIVPQARGRSRSLPEAAVLTQLRRLSEQGFQEAVLTGIHLGFYGKDHGANLVALLKSLEREPGIPPRIRLSSIEPQEFSPELIALIAGSNRICRHLHLPLQSGDDSVLRRMRRLYTRQEFRRVVLELYQAMPELCLGLDVIAGFPGESEADFIETITFLESLAWSYLHVFPFSVRPGTAAAEMDQQLVPPVIRARAARLRELGSRRRQAFYAQAVGKRLRLLVEDRRAGWQRGFSDQYVPLRFQSEQDWQGRLVEVRVQGADQQGGWGVLA